MDDNQNPIAQPLVPYEWPNVGSGVFPGLVLYGDSTSKSTPGVYVNEFVELPAQASVTSAGQMLSQSAVMMLLAVVFGFFAL